MDREPDMTVETLDFYDVQIIPGMQTAKANIGFSSAQSPGVPVMGIFGAEFSVRPTERGGVWCDLKMPQKDGANVAKLGKQLAHATKMVLRREWMNGATDRGERNRSREDPDALTSISGVRVKRASKKSTAGTVALVDPMCSGVSILNAELMKDFSLLLPSDDNGNALVAPLTEKMGEQLREAAEIAFLHAAKHRLDLRYEWFIHFQKDQLKVHHAQKEGFTS